MKVISTDELTKNYGKSRGIENVSIDVEEGEIFGFIGPNGAGKSTTIKLLLNLIYPTSGNARILDMDIIKDSAKIKKEIGYVPSDVRYYPFLTGEEMLKYSLSFHGIDSSERIDDICNKLDIEKHKKIEALSMGNRKKLAIGCALIHEPRLIILDEPTNGLDPLVQRRLFELLRERVEGGATVFISSHNLNEVQEHCSRVAFIKEGKILKIQELNKNRIDTKIITLKGDELKDDILSGSEISLIYKDSKAIKYAYKGEVDKMVSMLSRINFESVKDLTVENMSLEDEFLEFYKGSEMEADNEKL